MTIPIEQYTDAELIEKIDAAADEMIFHKGTIDTAKTELIRRHNDTFSTALKAKDEPYGGVNVISDGFKIEYTVPKKIDWDQDKLTELWKKTLPGMGEEPEEYIKAAFSVAEAAYKNWPKSLRDIFVDARTVSAGSPSLKITAVKEKA